MAEAAKKTDDTTDEAPAVEDKAPDAKPETVKAEKPAKKDKIQVHVIKNDDGSKNAISENFTASLRQVNGLDTLNVSKKGWIGPGGLDLPADRIAELSAVISKLQ